jgi:hypothetical protein
MAINILMSQLRYSFSAYVFTVFVTVSVLAFRAGSTVKEFGGCRGDICTVSWRASVFIGGVFIVYLGSDTNSCTCFRVSTVKIRVHIPGNITIAGDNVSLNKPRTHWAYAAVVPHNSACTGHLNPDSANVRNVTKSLQYFLLFLFWFALHSCKERLMCHEVVRVFEIVNFIVNFVNYTSASTREVYVIFSGLTSFTSLIWLFRVSYRIRLHVPITYELRNSTAISSYSFQIMAYHAHNEYTSVMGVTWRGGGDRPCVCLELCEILKLEREGRLVWTIP